MKPFVQSMKRWLTLACVVALAYNSISTTQALPTSLESLKRSDERLYNLVRDVSPQSPMNFDHNSFYLNGKPFIIDAAEFHPWRLPVPGLWRDVLQKLKAGGYNTVSIYTHWALTTPSSDPSSISLDGPANRLADFLTIAKEVGIFILLRPGPYINAESTGGGMPGWIQNIEAQLRTNGTNWNNAWQPYMKAIVDAAVPFQVKIGSGNSLDISGGTLLAVQVENEFADDDGEMAYFNEIIDFYQQNGLYIPTTFNAIGSNSYLNDQQLDIWGKDAYFQGEDCTNPYDWQSLQNNTDLNQLRPSNPGSIPEFQAGAYDNWGGAGYENCAEMTNGSFINVAQKQAFGDGIKFKNDYAGFGGTNWGNLAFGTFVYTSYDYGAGIDENRMIRSKARTSTLLSSFFQSFPTFASSPLQQQDNNLGVSNQSEDITVSYLKNVNGTGSYYIVRHADNTASTIATFNLNVGDVTIPQNGKMTIVGRDSIIVPVDVDLSQSGLVLSYSTADVPFVSTIGDMDVALIYGTAGYSYEFALSGSNLGTVVSPDPSITVTQKDGSVVVQWTPSSNSMQQIQIPTTDGKQVLIRLADVDYANGLQFPNTHSGGDDDFVLNWGNDRVLVHGAYHIANASLSNDGSTLALFGQLNGTSTSSLDILAPSSVKLFTFNGMTPSSISTDNSGLQGSFSAASDEALNYSPPVFGSWKYQNSLPEIQSGYKPDSNWKSANLTSTPNAWFNDATTPNVLFADAYGFYSGGAVLWQGRFDSSNTNISAVANQLGYTYYGGQYFATSTFLNDKFVGSTSVGGVEYTNGNFSLTSDMFVDGENVFTVIIDSTGLQEWGSDDLQYYNGYTYPRETAKMPRGIFQFDILSSDGTKNNVTLDWIVTGNQGGDTLLDKTRGPLNEGGLYGERQGWHLPGFDDSSWPSQDPTSSSGGVQGANVGFYRTSVDLNIPSGYDVPIAFVYDGASSDSSQSWRALLYVNGWQFGKRFVKFGPQTSFPIPPGILDPNGSNEIVLAVWSIDGSGAVLPNLSLQKQGVFIGAPDYTVNNPTYQQVRGG